MSDTQMQAASSSELQELRHRGFAAWTGVWRQLEGGNWTGCLLMVRGFEPTAVSPSVVGLGQRYAWPGRGAVIGGQACETENLLALPWQALQAAAFHQVDVDNPMQRIAEAAGCSLLHRHSVWHCILLTAEEKLVGADQAKILLDELKSRPLDLALTE